MSRLMKSYYQEQKSSGGGGGGDKFGGLHPNSLFLKQQFCWDSLFGY